LSRSFPFFGFFGGGGGFFGGLDHPFDFLPVVPQDLGDFRSIYQVLLVDGKGRVDPGQFILVLRDLRSPGVELIGFLLGELPRESRLLPPYGCFSPFQERLKWLA